MAVASFPEKGAQIRRKNDGTLGDVYASEPAKDILTVRWPTVPGAYATRDCSFEQFARDWEPTGVHLAAERPGRTAPLIIGLVILMFFVFVLARTRWPSYTAYDVSKILAADSLATLDDPQALDQKYGAQASAQCGAGADAYLGSIAGNNYEWDPAGTAFNTYRTNVTAPGVLTVVSSQAQIATAAGVLQPIVLLCNYDTRHRKVLSYSYTVQPGVQ
jgi:hypothetical protein